MEVHLKHGKVTQNMNGASRNYRYVWDVPGGYLDQEHHHSDWHSSEHLIYKTIF